MVGMFMECICYGVFLVTLGSCLSALLIDHDSRWGWKRHVNWPMLLVALMLFAIGTLNVAVGLRYNLEAFVYHSGPEETIKVFDDISYWPNVIKELDYTLQTIIGDGLLIYRCFMVYGRNVIVILPSVLLWIGSAVSGFLLTARFATTRFDALDYAAEAHPYVAKALLSLTLLTNVLTTGKACYLQYVYRNLILSKD